jgi:hypothetical protein
MALMDHSMVAMAKKCKVVEIRRPAMDPTNEVMSITP